jgi:hypothetical protein
VTTPTTALRARTRSTSSDGQGQVGRQDQGQAHQGRQGEGQGEERRLPARPVDEPVALPGDGGCGQAPLRGQEQAIKGQERASDQAQKNYTNWFGQYRQAVDQATQRSQQYAMDATNAIKGLADSSGQVDSQNRDQMLHRLQKDAATRGATVDPSIAQISTQALASRRAGLDNHAAASLRVGTAQTQYMNDQRRIGSGREVNAHLTEQGRKRNLQQQFTQLKGQEGDYATTYKAGRVSDERKTQVAAAGLGLKAKDINAKLRSLAEQRDEASIAAGNSAHHAGGGEAKADPQGKPLSPRPSGWRSSATGAAEATTPARTPPEGLEQAGQAVGHLDQVQHRHHEQGAAHPPDQGRVPGHPESRDHPHPEREGYQGPRGRRGPRHRVSASCRWGPTTEPGRATESTSASASRRAGSLVGFIGQVQRTNRRFSGPSRSSTRRTAVRVIASRPVQRVVRSASPSHIAHGVLSSHGVQRAARGGAKQVRVQRQAQAAAQRKSQQQSQRKQIAVNLLNSSSHGVRLPKTTVPKTVFNTKIAPTGIAKQAAQQAAKYQPQQSSQVKVRASRLKEQAGTSLPKPKLSTPPPKYGKGKNQPHPFKAGKGISKAIDTVGRLSAQGVHMVPPRPQGQVPRTSRRTRSTSPPGTAQTAYGVGRPGSPRRTGTRSPRRLCTRA